MARRDDRVLPVFGLSRRFFLYLNGRGRKRNFLCFGHRNRRRGDDRLVDLLAVDHQKRGRAQSDEVLRGKLSSLGDHLSVAENAVWAAQIFDENAVIIIDDEASMLSRNA